MRVTMFTQLHHNPPTPHLVRHCAGGSGTGEGIKDEIARICRDGKNTLNKPLGFRCVKSVRFAKPS